MKKTPYRRPDLAAVRHGHLHWQEEVREWLDQADDWLAGRATGTDGERAHDLVALHGKLTRLDPALLGPLDDCDTHRHLASAIEAGGRELIEQAVAAIDLDGWREELAALDQAVDSADADAAEVVRWAAELLDELDDAELICWAGQRSGAEPAGPRDALDGCVREVVRRGSVLLHAGVFVQALGWAIRPDLPAADPDLADTARKLVYLLDLLEEVEVGREPLPPWQLPGSPPCTQRIVPAADELQLNVIPACAPAPPIAARPEEEVAALPPFRWERPGERVEARMVIPQKAPPDGKLYLEFRGGSYGGQPVVLGGLRGTVNPRGYAAFDWEDVRAVEPFLDVLLVGQQKWKRID